MKARITRCTNIEQVKELDRIIFGDELPVETADSVWWVVTIDGCLVGFGGVHVPGKYGAFLTRSGIVKSCRGHGLQKRLIKIREKYAKEHSANKVVTYTMNTNYPSMNSLISCGYKMFNPEYAYVGREDVIYWIKTL